MAWLPGLVPDLRGHTMARRHPVVLAGAVADARDGYRTARTELGETVPPHAVDAALTTYRRYAAKLPNQAQPSPAGQLRCALRSGRSPFRAGIPARRAIRPEAAAARAFPPAGRRRGREQRHPEILRCRAGRLVRAPAREPAALDRAVASKFSCPPSRGRRPRSPPVMTASPDAVAGGLVVRALRSACVAQVPAGWGGSAKCDSGAVAGGALCWWCSGIALAWKGRHARRRWPGRPAGVAAGVAPVRWLAGGGQCCRGLSLRGRCRRLAEAGRVGGHAGASA